MARRRSIILIATLIYTGFSSAQPLRTDVNLPPATASQTTPIPADSPKSANENQAQPTQTTDDVAETKAKDKHPFLNLPTEQPAKLITNFEIRGRIEAEATGSSQSAQSRASIGDLVDGFGFRRVRLGAQGNIGNASSWVSEVELAGGSVRLRDVFIGLDTLPLIRQLRVGHFREPYSLEGMTSTNFMTFLERSSANVLAPARNWGVCAFYWTEDERTLLTFGGFRDGTGSNGQSSGNPGSWAYTLRLTTLPIDEKSETDPQLWHVGAALSHRTPPDNLIRFSPRTVSNLLTVEDNPGSPFLPVLEIPTTNYQIFNLQTAYVDGPVSVQAEWNAAGVNIQNSDYFFVHGSYLALSYFLTGENRTYNRRRGSFDEIKVLRPFLKNENQERNGIGAWEFTSRVGFTDFSSPNLPPDVNGNPSQTKLFEMTFGTNWYLNTNTRVMFNYTFMMPDKVTFGRTSAHIFGLRTALFW